MNEKFKNLFSRQPEKIENEIYFYDAGKDGDWFDESDVQSWQESRFDKNWNDPKLLENQASRFLLEQIARRELPVVDVACGPGMGLIPSLKKLSPQHICLASDASSTVISEWQKYFGTHENLKNVDLSFAQFSLMDIPFKNNSVPAYSSYIGISSTRNGNAGKEKALNELYRTLCSGGYFYTIENEWKNLEEIPKLFESMGKEIWSIFQEPQIPWREQFQKAGFKIEYEKTVQYKKLSKDDNELGIAAEKLGIEIGIIDTAFILKKE